MSQESQLYVPPHRRAPLAEISDNSAVSADRSTARSTLATKHAVTSRSPTPRDPGFAAFLSLDRPGPGPRKRQHRSTASYTRVAVHYSGLGERVLDADFDPQKLEVIEGEAIDGIEYVGSYKWVQGEGQRPTIAVPAVPDIWDPPESVGQLKLDKFIPDYQEFPDYAAALLPENLSTLEPTFLCLDTPSSLSNVDILTGRNSLRKLWSALDPTYADHAHPFRIDLVTIGGLLMLERFEPSAQQERHEPNGYHLSYHEATTRPVLQGSDRTPGCIRVVKHRFGGLNMMVKFDVAACLPPKAGSQASVSRDALFDTRDCDTDTDADVDTCVNDEDLDGVSTNMEDLDMVDSPLNGHSIAVLHTRLIHPPQEDLVTIKTKIHHHPADLGYYFPQLYFAQITRLHYARHASGDFSKHPLEIYDLLSRVYVQEYGPMIDKMAAMLRWLVAMSKEHGGEGKPLALVWDGRRFSLAFRLEGPELSEPVKEMIRGARELGGDK